MEDIVNRLESANEFCESMEARQLRKDAAEEIRRLRREVEALKGDEE
tara:strand:+ start:10714 stop:10854 length:141 start_codon:yes stop_codon:yes gene_type:complete